MGRPVEPRRRDELRRNRLIAARRGGDGLPVPIPIGPVASTYRAPGAPVVIETSVMPAGTLALRGRMVPTHALQPHAGRPLPDHTGYVDTGFACNRGRNAKTLIVTALLCLRVATLCGPVVPVIARVRGDEDAAVPIALPSDGALPVGRLLARLQFATRVRALHATVLRRIDLFASHDGKLANVPGRRCSRRRNCADRRTRSALPDPQCRNGRASQDRRCTQCRGRGQTPQYPGYRWHRRWRWILPAHGRGIPHRTRARPKILRHSGSGDRRSAAGFRRRASQHRSGCRGSAAPRRPNGATGANARIRRTPQANAQYSSGRT